MNEMWRIVPLSAVCTLDKVQGTHRNLPYVGLEHVESNTARFIGSLDPQTVKSMTFHFSSEHILYGRLRPYLNKVLAPSFEGHCSTEIFPLKLSPVIFRKYLLYWFLSEEIARKINATCTGTRMPRANMNQVLDFPFPLPSLSEQQRIVGILDKAFESIAVAKANAGKNLQNARDIFESNIHAVFAQVWNENEIVCLADLSKSITDGDHLPPPKAKTGVPFITISNINKRTNEIEFDNTFKVSQEYLLNLKPDRKPKRGDVLYTVTGSFGIPVLVDNDIEFCFQRHIGLIRPKSSTDSVWLKYLLMSPQVFSQASEMATGTAQKTVSLSVLRKFRVPNVPLSKQRVIVDRLDTLSAETRRLESIYERKLAALDELKKSLLHQAFTGQL